MMIPLFPLQSYGWDKGILIFTPSVGFTRGEREYILRILS